jgi:hypothetical protein
MDDLTGTLVAVHPDTGFDPAKKQGMVGIVTSADLETDDFYVSFGKGEQARYPSGALLVLKESSQIYKDLLTKYKHLDHQDFKDLFEINLLQQNGNTQAIKQAMVMALKTEKLLEFGMMTLQDKLGIEVAPDIEREQTQKMGVAR